MLPAVKDLARGLALFLGLFTLLNLAGTDANIWWIDLWPMPAPLAQIVLALFAVAMIAFAFRPRPGRARAFASSVLIGLAAAGSVVDTIRFYVILARGEIRSSLPIPLSLLVLLVLMVIFAGLHHDRRGERRRVIAIAFAGAAILFPLAQISLFGLTDYRRRADVIVVFGAHTYADGTPSTTLANRVRTGCRLYTDGLAPRLLFSGGPGDGPVDEPEAMRRLAIRLGVPDAAIVCDSNGINTESTVRNTAQLFPRKRILAVSDFYHLPRIKMTYQRYGIEVYTVPAERTELSTMPFNLAREDAAFWRYYLRRWGI